MDYVKLLNIIAIISFINSCLFSLSNRINDPPYRKLWQNHEMYQHVFYFHP